MVAHTQSRPSLLQDELVDEFVLLRLHFGQGLVLDSVPETHMHDTTFQSINRIRQKNSRLDDMSVVW